MPSPILLNNVDHADVRIRTGHSAAFGDAVNQITIFPTEFEELQAEFPILFRRDPDGIYYSVALLGLDLDENLFLDDRGWQGRIVPALLQRGPFSIGIPGEGSNGEPMIHIDLSHPRVSRSEGEPIFLSQGGNSSYLDHVAAVLRAIYVGIEVTKPMFAAFEAYDVIEPIAIEIKLSDTRQYNVPDCFTISQQRLMKLGGADLEALHRADFLRAAIWVASSLRNIRHLVDMKNAREAAI